MQVLQSGSFKKKVRRMGNWEKRVLDNQVRKILKNPAIGREKKGELRGVFVHKFKIHTTQYLLSTT